MVVFWLSPSHAIRYVYAHAEKGYLDWLKAVENAWRFYTRPAALLPIKEAGATI